ncbi:hypothetical protein DNH61_24910 [Paenibacillus sambharensis]|uniref:Glycoside hydrolase n=1 Tax=Paenibacillus sambharensis TaxID=1803190 RepID=A0A2W1L2A2_9BACL|nr:carbohydrate binding domain-containing protein [Paenibacillus sambharensis]PZD93029.1 hypothetical protein DNH61_24910 [Paenibacillus sambharensis]
MRALSSRVIQMSRRKGLNKKRGLLHRITAVLLCVVLAAGYGTAAGAVVHQEADIQKGASVQPEAAVQSGAAVQPESAAGKDAAGHWAEPALHKWHAQGLLSGYPGGSLRPDQPMTRAELVTMMNTVFGFTGTGSTSFKDVSGEEWYAQVISSAARAGYIAGYPDGSFRPNQAVTREQGAHMLAGLFQLPAQQSSALASYQDASQVSAYAQESLARLVGSGSMGGYPDGTLRPRKPVTRAEMVTLLERLAPRIIQQGGTYTGEAVHGNLLVRSAAAVIRDASVDGNVFLTAGVGEGDAHVQRSAVKGVLFVNGGGANSVYVADSTAQRIELDKKEGAVRIVLSGSSQISRVDVKTPAIIEVEEGASVGTVEIGQGAIGTKVLAAGGIGEIMNHADDTLLNGKELDKGVTKPASDKGQSAPGGSSQPSSGVTPGSGNVQPPVEPDLGTGNPQPPAEPDPGTGSPQPPAEPDPGTGSPQPPAEPDPGRAEDWTLVWSDEFEGTGTNLDDNGVNLDLWDYQLGTGAQYGLDGWGNNEQQYYRAENARVEDGRLIIEARNDGYGGKPYTSARLYTQPTFTKKYGKFEARMKLPVGQGFWPAFWMMPASDVYGGWAASGEIDIMEARGRLPGEIGGTIHYGESWPLNRYSGKDYHFPEGTDISDFHTYAVEWEPGVIRWYVDGNLYQEQNSWDSWGKDMPAKYAFPAPFDQEFYLILNLAVGGNYDNGRVPDASMLPSSMEVDYVRVYELTGRPYNTPVEPLVEAEPLPAGAKEAVDGNYVHDTRFEQAIKEVAAEGEALDSSGWNFVHISTFDGDGSIGVEPLEGSPFAKIDISRAGNAVHSVQLIQNVTLGKGRWYRLSFDAKAAAERAMTVKLGGGADRGWTGYSRALDAQLGTGLQSYELVFQMEKESDPLARLEFNLGLNRSTVWIGNVKLEEAEAPELYPDLPKVPVNGNHVYNGTFDMGRMDRMTYWHFITNGAAAEASVHPDTRELKIGITDGGHAADAVRLVQPGMKLITGNQYQITFDARADEARTLQAAVWSKDGSAVYAVPQDVQLTAEMETKTVTFEMQSVSDPEGQLVFLLGGSTADVYLDNVVVTRLTNDTGELTLDEQFPLKNGDFSLGTANWSEHVQGRWDGWDHDTRFTAENGGLTFHIAGAGNNPWDVMLMQNDFPLRSGNTYVVSIDARSTLDRPVEIVIDADGQRYLSETVQLTGSAQRFSFELPVTDDLTASFKLLMGKVDGLQAGGAHDVYVDNVRVEQKGAREQAFLAANGDFAEGLSGWDTHWQGQYDGPSSVSFQADTGELHAAIAHAGVNPWDIMLMQTDKLLKQDQTYVVSFDARSTLPRTIEAVIDNSEYTRFLSESVQLTPEMQTYSFEVRMDSDQTAGLKLLMGAAEGMTADSHDIFIDNVRLELKGASEALGGTASAS